jgi:hypothetical protein
VVALQQAAQRTVPATVVRQPGRTRPAFYRTAGDREFIQECHSPKHESTNLRWGGAAHGAERVSHPQAGSKAHSDPVASSSGSATAAGT